MTFKYFVVMKMATHQGIKTSRHILWHNDKIISKSKAKF